MNDNQLLCLGRPIHPEEVIHKQKFEIPNFVYDAFNELIVEKMKPGPAGHASFTQQEIVCLIKTKMGGGNNFNILWLDIENAYRQAGWDVFSIKAEPGFLFSPKKELKTPKC